jgi:molybdate transport system regulatory protein
MDAQGAAQVSVEINFPNGGVFGREEILLIDAIRAQRSIIGASRALGVSYRKCWLIVDAEKSLAEVTSSLDWNFDPKARSVAGARDLA